MNDVPDLPVTLDRRKHDDLPDIPREPLELLKTVAVAEAAEKMFARAKDETGLYAAVEQKLGAQRGFVIWWDGQEKAEGGDKRSEDYHRNRPLTVVAGENGLPDRETISRWRKKLADPRKFDETLEAAAERCRKICEAEKGQTAQRGASGTGENEWHTPDAPWRILRHESGNYHIVDAAEPLASAIHIECLSVKLYGTVGGADDARTQRRDRRATGKYRYRIQPVIRRILRHAGLRAIRAIRVPSFSREPGGTEIAPTCHSTGR